MDKSEIFCQGFNIRDDLKDKTLDEVISIQKESTIPYSIATFNVMGDLNIGNILRSGVLFGAEKAFIFGKKKYDRRSTVGAQNYIDISYFQEEYTKSSFEKIIFDNGYTPIYVEQNGHDYKEEFSKLNDFANLYEIRKPCFIFGSESDGIPFELDFEKDCIISILQFGVMRSLNVSVAAGIIMAEYSSYF